MKKLVLVIFVSLLLISGCSTTVKTNNISNMISCTPQYPRPVILSNLKKDDDFITKKGIGILINATGWSKVVGWQHEIERFGIDAINLQLYMEDCINNYNNALKEINKPIKKPGFFKRLFKGSN